VAILRGAALRPLLRMRIEQVATYEDVPMWLLTVRRRFAPSPDDAVHRRENHEAA
jgi:hypothetical protein